LHCQGRFGTFIAAAAAGKFVTPAFTAARMRAS